MDAISSCVHENEGQICLCSLPRRVIKPSLFAQQRYGPFVLCHAELWSNATFAPQTHGDTVLGAKKNKKNINKYIYIYLF